MMASGAGRPPLHCLTFVLLLAVAAAGVPPAGAALAGLSPGAAAHLVRDVATGPGIPLLWPVATGAVVAPHGAYRALMVVLIGAATPGRLRVTDAVDRVMLDRGRAAR